MIQGKSKNVTSLGWFSAYAHRWPKQALPVGYAMACIEVVANSYAKAGELYRHAVEAWGKPGCIAFREEITSMLSDSERDEVQGPVKVASLKQITIS